MMNNQNEREALRIAERLRQLAESQRMDFDSPDVAKMLDEAADLLAANFHRTPSPSVVTTVEGLEALPYDAVIRDDAGWVYEKWPDMGWVCAGDDVRDGHDIRLPVTVLTPTSPPPSEVRVTGEQMAALRAIAEAGPFIDGEMGYCLTCQFRERSREDYNAGPEKHDPDCVWAVAHRAAGIPVAGEES